MIFHFIERNRSSFPVKKMCHVLEVSQSGYYRWMKAPVSNRKAAKKRFRARIKELYDQHNGMIGSPMLTADLHDDSEFSKVSRTRVARHMKELGLKERICTLLRMNIFRCVHSNAGILQRIFSLQRQRLVFHKCNDHFYTLHNTGILLLQPVREYLRRHT